MPLFGETRLVEDQATVRLAAEKPVGIRTDLRQHRFVPPRRMIDEMLKLLSAAIFDDVGHRLERAGGGLRQTLQITLRHRRIVAPARCEQPTIAPQQLPERIRDLFDTRSSKRTSSNTVTRRTACITSPCS